MNLLPRFRWFGDGRPPSLFQSIHLRFLWVKSMDSGNIAPPASYHGSYVLLSFLLYILSATFFHQFIGMLRVTYADLQV